MLFLCQDRMDTRCFCVKNEWIHAFSPLEGTSRSVLTGGHLTRVGTHRYCVKEGGTGATGLYERLSIGADDELVTVAGVRVSFHLPDRTLVT